MALLMSVCVLQLDRMEVKLQEKVAQLQGFQERKLQLEESVQGLRPRLLREMKNTLEKYSKSMTVARHPASPFARSPLLPRVGPLHIE